MRPTQMPAAGCSLITSNHSFAPLHLQVAQTTTTVAQTVGTTTKTMSAMQQAMNPAKISATMQQFAKVCAAIAG